MKKIFCFIMVAVLMLALFCGCNATNSKSGKKLSVVVTVFPYYDMLQEILGEKKDSAEITLLLDNGVDLHSFQPTANDIINISKCDLFIYNGGESDRWVEDALKEKSNKNMIALNLLDYFGSGARAEESVEGMQEEKEHEGEEEGEEEYDEHIWLSLKNAQKCTNAICESLKKADSNNADVYTKNAESFSEKLSELDKSYTEVTKNAKRKTLLFADRFPFLYLTKDYSIEYFAAFKGCSAESEASFETVAFLADKVKELNLPYVITLEGNDGKLAKTVIDTSGVASVEVLNLDSMQSKIKEGDTYLKIMEKNLETIKKALN